MYFKVGANGWVDSPLFVNIPFMHQMLITCLLSIGIVMLISYQENKGADDAKAIIHQKDTFKTDPKFNLAATVILLLLVALYAIFW